MSDRVKARSEEAEGRRAVKEQLDRIQVEGAPDADRMVAALEWLLYRRGPLTRSMRRMG